MDIKRERWTCLRVFIPFFFAMQIGVDILILIYIGPLRILKVKTSLRRCFSFPRIFVIIWENRGKRGIQVTIRSDPRKFYCTFLLLVHHLWNFYLSCSRVFLFYKIGQYYIDLRGGRRISRWCNLLWGWFSVIGISFIDTTPCPYSALLKIWNFSCCFAS
jgi:hypothetical protein